MKDNKKEGRVTALPKKVAAVHDLSCFGRCALTVVIPALSAMENQVIPIPTALLSTHTGGFSELHFRDLSDDMEKIFAHFSKLSLDFDAIYTGFLGSEVQIETVGRFIEKFGKKSIVLVDPVMGDDGELYSTYTEQLMLGMRKLCEGADVITPNITEACFLTDTPYTETANMSESEARRFVLSLYEKLSVLGAKQTVITGIVHSKSKSVATAAFDSRSNESFFYSVEKLEKGYPGTGDLFASVLLGKLLQKDTLEQSVKFASDYIHRVIEYSQQFDTPQREGVALEKCIKWLI